MNIQGVFHRIGLIVSVFLLGCSSMQNSAKIQGSVRYLERMALPPTAQVEIILADVSLADAPYQLIRKKTIVPTGQVPIEFEIEYDSKVIIPSHTYAVMARITDAGQLLFINDRSYQVITRDQPSRIDMILKRVTTN